MNVHLQFISTPSWTNARCMGHVSLLIKALMMGWFMNGSMYLLNSFSPLYMHIIHSMWWIKVIFPPFGRSWIHPYMYRSWLVKLRCEWLRCCLGNTIGQACALNCWTPFGQIGALGSQMDQPPFIERGLTCTVPYIEPIMHEPCLITLQIQLTYKNTWTKIKSHKIQLNKH